jgi:hypothetical protein
MRRLLIPCVAWAVVIAASGSSHGQATPGPARATPQTAFPLKLSANGRYLQDQNGKPFLLIGDTAWSIAQALTLWR